MLLAGVAHFAYFAHLDAVCSETTSDLITSHRWFKPDPNDCADSLLSVAPRLQLDAWAAIVGTLLTIGSLIALSRTRRRTKKALLVAEAAAVVLAIVYAILLRTVWP